MRSIETHFLSYKPWLLSFWVVGAIRAARVNAGDAVWQKPHVLLDSLFDACHSALLRRRYLHAVRLMRL